MTRPSGEWTLSFPDLRPPYSATIEIPWDFGAMLRRHHMAATGIRTARHSGRTEEFLRVAEANRGAEHVFTLFTDARIPITFHVRTVLTPKR